ncbi:MAG: VOC family protein, partial [Pseudomonadota bacterium]|nr:VOC family protein [Pseudomonadota bacterium]
MTAASPLSLDHVGFMVRDLDAAVARWERLGFLLSRRSPQMGKVPGKSEMAPWASSNHCAMFEHGYLELIGITNPENFNPWSRFLDRFEGPHITALRCENGEEAYKALSGRIDHFDPPLQRLRNAPYGDGVREFRFRNIFSQDD